ncbi:DUF2141 domain-containing protein [Roseibium sp. MMSF_3412]|uniref:DUF2141 domain-containing protein n=1 Tax=Roseibium sp. MMSF_3412 TaxID=3046712 RepID=UPI00273F0415|nr:DUF2141 domain-containing protein [Roseibium sp. MMSF_3412]
MATAKQRLSAILISAAILIVGAFTASLVRSGETNENTNAVKGLEVTVEGVRNGNGNVIIIVMNDADAFNASEYANAAGYHEIPASPGNMTTTFPRLTSGRYAVVAFHDENGNRDFDMKHNLPAEGYAISGAKDASDTPLFDRAASDKSSRKVEMYYLD